MEKLYRTTTANNYSESLQDKLKMTMMVNPGTFLKAHAGLRPLALTQESQCQQTLSKFQSHDLEDQMAVNLANRTDSKYIFPIDMLPSFIESLRRDHTILVANSHRIFTYENTYFDTLDWALYLAHHNGKLNRYKCRFRRYLETDTAYMEIKFKSNKGRTIKDRVPWPRPPGTDNLKISDALVPSLYNNYRRMSFWNHSTDERLTVDFDINFRRPGQRDTVRVDRFFIAELKRFGNAYDSPFLLRAKRMGYTPKSISKYCTGVCLTDNGRLKKNRFNILLRLLENFQPAGVLQA